MSLENRQTIRSKCILEGIDFSRNINEKAMQESAIVSNLDNTFTVAVTKQSAKSHLTLIR